MGTVAKKGTVRKIFKAIILGYGSECFLYLENTIFFQGRNKATTNLGVLNTYDYLFDRHLRMLTHMESDQEDLVNEEEVKTLREIHQPLVLSKETMELEEEAESLTESDELSIIGEDLVNRSLAEVTSLLDQQLELSGEKEKKSTKRISFLVPTNVPQISVSSAGSADES